MMASSKWKHFPHYWPFVWGIHLSPVNFPHKGQCRKVLVFSLICAWTNSWANYGDAGDLRRHRAHYGVTVMRCIQRRRIWIMHTLEKTKLRNRYASWHIGIWKRGVPWRDHTHTRFSGSRITDTYFPSSENDPLWISSFRVICIVLLIMTSAM